MALPTTDQRLNLTTTVCYKSQASYNSSQLGRNLGEFPFLTVYEVEILNPDHAMFNSEIEDNPRDFNIL